MPPLRKEPSTFPSRAPAAFDPSEESTGQQYEAAQEITSPLVDSPIGGDAIASGCMGKDGRGAGGVNRGATLPADAFGIDAGAKEPTAVFSMGGGAGGLPVGVAGTGAACMHEEVDCVEEQISTS
ncbi:hypothetical protein ACSSS7_000266 [Eimeria intestinalis]